MLLIFNLIFIIYLIDFLLFHSVHNNFFLKILKFD